VYDPAQDNHNTSTPETRRGAVCVINHIKPSWIVHPIYTTMLAVAVWVQGSSCIMWCSKVLPEGILLKSLICQRDPVGKSSGGGTPASFLYYDYREDFHHLHARLKGNGGNAERSCSTLLQIISFCSPTSPVGRSQYRLISSPKTCLSLKGHGFPYWAGTQSNVSQVHIASESYCMYAPTMCRNASVGRRILLPEVFVGKPAVVVYEALVSTLPLRRLCGVLIQARAASQPVKLGTVADATTARF